MKFSVLIPSRNRLQYLKYAIDSVRLQKYQNWEIIISDNYSDEVYEGFIRSLNDPRIRYFRTESFVSATDNWNNALEKSSGDYVVMLGDDDCILPEYFNIYLELLQAYQFPDMAYNSAVEYTYPNVHQEIPQGQLIQYAYSVLFAGKTSHYLLDPTVAIKCIQKTMNFTIPINFNPQHILYKRSVVEEMKKYGPFYQSLYPDYYSTLALFAHVHRVLVVPSPMVVIGVTPKSFGFYYMSNQEKEGELFLQNSLSAIDPALHKIIIPGTQMNIFWLSAMKRVKDNFAGIHRFRINYQKFRLLQTLHQCRKFACKEGVDIDDMRKFRKHLHFWEQCLYFPLFIVAFLIRRVFQSKNSKQWANKMAYALSHAQCAPPVAIQGKFENILEVFHAYNQHESERLS